MIARKRDAFGPIWSPKDEWRSSRVQPGLARASRDSSRDSRVIRVGARDTSLCPRLEPCRRNDDSEWSPGKATRDYALSLRDRLWQRFGNERHSIYIWRDNDLRSVFDKERTTTSAAGKEDFCADLEMLVECSKPSNETLTVSRAWARA